MVRHKNRYLLIELVWNDKKVDDSLNEQALLSVLRDSLEVNFGDYGLGSALASVQVKYYNPYTHLCVIRCGTDEHRQVWCALSLITDIRHRKLIIRQVHLGGTLKSCQAAAVVHNQALLRQLKLGQHQRAAAEALGQKLLIMDL